MKSFFTSINIFLFILLSASAFPQTGVGKLSGKVIDADTKEPLIGANILILDTQLGGASDAEGNYYILNIIPGTYSVRASYVGYAPKTIQDVRIVAGITYELNVELSTDFTLPEIVVENKKFFEEKATNTVRVVDADQIARLPVRGVTNIASLQSGVVIREGSGGAGGNAEINIRGGRGSEVLYIVDGVPQNNLYTRTSITQVSNAAIDQISFQVGGYEAKYGQAQSGIINVTTKAGDPFYSFFAEAVSSGFTDNYGYNIYSGTLGGPIIPGISNHTFFFSAERGWFKDADPTAVPVEFTYLENGEFVKKSFDNLPNNPEDTWRFTGRTSHRFGSFAANLGIIYNDRTSKAYSHRAAKYSSRFFDELFEKNISLSSRVSQTISNSTFWNLTVGYRMFNFKRYNPYFEDNQLAYGDSALWAQMFGVTLQSFGQTVSVEPEGGVVRPYGYATNLFQKRENNSLTFDFDFTSQVTNHLLELGAGVASSIVRGYGNFPSSLSGKLLTDPSLTIDELFYSNAPFVYGYDLSGNNEVGTDYSDPLAAPGQPLARADKLQAARNPLIAYVYLQDRYELDDLVLNIGVRADYFDIKSYEFVNPNVPFAGGLDPSSFDNEDFKLRDPEIKISPRIGIGFPVTDKSVFHLMYGKFIQLPELNDVYFGPFDLDTYITTEPQGVQSGSIESEETTQYEMGYRQILSDFAALNVTLFYKNIRGLVNSQNTQYRTDDGPLTQIKNAIISTNADFGTTKGLALSLDLTRMDYFRLSAQYTYSIAEGTGSSTSSSQTAVFRNNDRLPPKVIAPLDFDQTHTAILNLDIYVPKGEMGFLEMLNANFLISYNSGRPYTPLNKYNIIGDNGILAETSGYINSRYTPSNFRIDMKVEKRFDFGGIQIAPYIWIENLLDADNIIDVWRSTGDPYTTNWLNTPEGKAAADNATNTEIYINDYKSLERTPANFGIPRLIRLGMTLNFTSSSL